MTVSGLHMAREMQEAASVFARAVVQPVAAMSKPKAIYTFARGSSDAVANILSYEFMARLEIPVTSLPPSVFSLGKGVALNDALALIISQSGASDDLVACAQAASQSIAITNVARSPVAAASRMVIPVMAGPEQAVPATKTVIGSIGAGMALLAAIDPDYHEKCLAAAAIFTAGIPRFDTADHLVKLLSKSDDVYVIGRQASFGAAQEIALKLKETCAIHAEAYSASEVLHGPLELSTKPITIVILDAGDDISQPSLDAAESRFRAQMAQVVRVRPTTAPLTPAAQAAVLLDMMYPIIHRTAVQLGLDPDMPQTLSKVTITT